MKRIDPLATILYILGALVVGILFVVLAALTDGLTLLLGFLGAVVVGVGGIIKDNLERKAKE